MPRYFLIHNVVRMPESQDWWVEDWKGLRKRTKERGEEKAAWLNSWYSAKDNVVICEWEAIDRDAILACFSPEELEMAPIRDAYEVAHMNPQWLDT
jgi:hypothetical protein